MSITVEKYNVKSYYFMSFHMLQLVTPSPTCLHVYMYIDNY